MSREPDGRSQLNRLSKDRQAAVADYAARHTLPETVQWLNSPAWAGNSSTRIVHRSRPRKPITPPKMRQRAENPGKVRKSPEKIK
jgi:hypothetical protein